MPPRPPVMLPSSAGFGAGTSASDGTRGRALATGLVVAAVALLGIPTFTRFAQVFWSKPDDTHAPIVLIGVLLGFWHERRALTWETAPAQRGVGLFLALVGAVLLAVGRAQLFYQLEGAGLLLFALGSACAMAVRTSWKRLALLFALGLFLIPLPATLMDAALLPLKLALTEAVVRSLAAAGLPVGSHGVIISIGFYQLQVADACAGLRSMLALTAIGLLFIHFVPVRGRHTHAMLLALIVPIALVANYCRVATLVLLTYGLGGDFSDRAHNIAGYAEIALTLALFVIAHWALERRAPQVRP